MSSKSMLLLKTMRASTSRINIIKYSHDKKKRRNAILALVGIAIGGLLIGGFIGAYAYAMAHFGFADDIPVFMATVLTVMSLILTMFKSNGYLYGFKEYDMLMSMPFSVRTIVSDRFLFMYLRDLPTNMLISLSILAGYSIESCPSAWTFVSWILLTPFISLLPTVISSLLGVFVADIGSRVKHKKLIQIILTFVLVIPCFFVQYIIEYLVENDKVGEVVEKTTSVVSGFGKVIPTVKWFEAAVNDKDVLSGVLLVAVSLVLYAGAILLIGKTYRRINSGLQNSVSRRKGKVSDKSFKRKSIIQSIAYKEFKRVTGSTICAVNIGMGTVFAMILGLVLPFINLESLITSMAKGAEFDIAPFKLMLPVVVYFFMGMMPSTTSSFSLEGKNYWIIKTMPIDMMKICKGKMLFNLYLNLIPGVFAVLMGFISLRANIIEIILGVLMITSMVMFSTLYGLKCGMKHMKLDWENEIEVVKQGTASAVYLFPNLFGTIMLNGLMAGCCYAFDGKAGALVIIVCYSLLALWNFHSVSKLAKTV